MPSSYLQAHADCLAPSQTHLHTSVPSTGLFSKHLVQKLAQGPQHRPFGRPHPHYTPWPLVSGVSKDSLEKRLFIGRTCSSQRCSKGPVLTPWCVNVLGPAESDKSVCVWTCLEVTHGDTNPAGGPHPSSWPPSTAETGSHHSPPSLRRRQGPHLINVPAGEI